MALLSGELLEPYAQIRRAQLNVRLRLSVSLFLFRKLNNPEARNLTRRSLTGHMHGVVLAGETQCLISSGHTLKNGS